MRLQNQEAETCVLAGLIKHGQNFYIDHFDKVTEDVFSSVSNSALFKSLQSLFDEGANEASKLSVLAKLKSIGMDSLVPEDELDAVIGAQIDPISAQESLKHIRRLHILRIFERSLTDSRAKIRKMTGEEPIGEALNHVNFDYSKLLVDDKEATHLAEGGLERLLALAENPVEQIGISTGYPMYDAAIGGGLRRGGVSIVAARNKVGKSSFVLNMAIYIAMQLKIPVLYMDTEMSQQEQQDRVISSLTEIPTKEISTGQFGHKPRNIMLVKEAFKSLEQAPLSFINISQDPFQEHLAHINRWIRKEVGLRPDGTANDCVVIYDYLKLTTGEDLSDATREYQMLGFMIESLKNTAVKYDMPIVSPVQINRDGINKESTDVAAGSDRILWTCSSFAIFKPKSHEEINKDGVEHGNRKLVVPAARFGPGIEAPNYINFDLNGDICKVREGKSRSEIFDERKSEKPEI